MCVYIYIYTANKPPRPGSPCLARGLPRQVVSE